MSSDEKKPKKITRRDFFKGAAVAGAAVARQIRGGKEAWSLASPKMGGPSMGVCEPFIGLFK
jgi:hypothetical protein